MDWGRRLQNVPGVAERWQVAHGPHVTGQGGRAEGRGLLLHALGKFLKTLGAFLVFLGLVGHFPIPGLNSFLFHGQGPIHIVQLVVQSAGVAHRVSICIAPP